MTGESGYGNALYADTVHAYRSRTYFYVYIWDPCGEQLLSPGMKVFNADSQDLVIAPGSGVLNIDIRSFLKSNYTVCPNFTPYVDMLDGSIFNSQLMFYTNATQTLSVTNITDIHLAGQTYSLRLIA